MRKQRQRKIRMLVTVALMVLVFAGMSVNASASIKKNADGTYSYYNSKNKLQKNTWIRIRKKTYYAGADGILYTKGVYRIGKYRYAFGKTGALRYGRCTVSGSTCYFDTKSGRMQKNKWIRIGGKYYYFLSDGTMARSRWVERYYVNNKGVRQKNRWVGNCYVGGDGKAYTGLHKIGKHYYYFKKKTHEKVVSRTVTVKGVTYVFDSRGRGTVQEPDPSADNEALLAAIIYCEAGNQSYTGQMAVGMVIMNRIYSSSFPNFLKGVIYQSSQFTPACNGSLARVLKNSSLVPSSCKKAAAEVLEKYDGYKSGQKVYLNINGKDVNFRSYLYFMSKASYNSFGLTASCRTIGAQVFFKVWK